MQKVDNVKATLSLDRKTYSDFQKYCSDNAIMLSKKVELIMKDIIKNAENNENLGKKRGKNE